MGEFLLSGKILHRLEVVDHYTAIGKLTNYIFFHYIGNVQ